MPSYTLHVDATARPGDARALETAIVVKDGFSWGASFFHLFWFLANRLWLGALGLAAALIAVAAACAALHVGWGPAVLALVAIVFLFALEASSIRRWTLRRNGLSLRDAVIADDQASAEVKAFARWLAPTGSPGPAGPGGTTHAGAARQASGILGLFPEPERGR